MIVVTYKESMEGKYDKIPEGMICQRIWYQEMFQPTDICPVDVLFTDEEWDRLVTRYKTDCIQLTSDNTLKYYRNDDEGWVHCKFEL